MLRGFFVLFFLRALRCRINLVKSRSGVQRGRREALRRLAAPPLHSDRQTGAAAQHMVSSQTQTGLTTHRGWRTRNFLGFFFLHREHFGFVTAPDNTHTPTSLFGQIKFSFLSSLGYIDFVQSYDHASISSSSFNQTIQDPGHKNRPFLKSRGPST